MAGTLHRRIVWLVMVLALASLSVSANARTPHPEEQKRSLITYLNAYEFKADRAVLDRIGPDIHGLLIEVASDRNQRAKLRTRAIVALALYPKIQTRKFLESLLYERDLVGTSMGTLIRRQAMRSLARAFRGEVVNVVSAFRSDKNPQIREGCAHALGDTQSRHALPILEAWVAHEKELAVRLAVDSAYNDILRKTGEKP